MILFGISLTNIILWALFGFIVGATAHLLDPSTVRGGIIGTAFLGIIGAIVGGFLASFIMGKSMIGFNLQGFIVAVVGSLIVAFVYRSVFREREHIKTITTKLK